METTNKFLELLKDLAEQLPSLLTILGCIVFAIVRWKRYRAVSQVVLVGLVLLLLHVFLFAVIYTWIPDLFIQSASYPTQASTIRVVYIVLGLINNTSLAVGVAVLLTAIFVQRPAGEQQRSVE